MIKEDHCGLVLSSVPVFTCVWITGGVKPFQYYMILQDLIVSEFANAFFQHEKNKNVYQNTDLKMDSFNCEQIQTSFLQ